LDFAPDYSNEAEASTVDWPDAKGIERADNQPMHHAYAQHQHRFMAISNAAALSPQLSRQVSKLAPASDCSWPGCTGFVSARSGKQAGGAPRIFQKLLAILQQWCILRLSDR
jgi:hypothetical protein